MSSIQQTYRQKQSFTIGVIISERDTGYEKESLAFLSIGRFRKKILGAMISRWIGRVNVKCSNQEWELSKDFSRPREWADDHQGTEAEPQTGDYGKRR